LTETRVRRPAPKTCSTHSATAPSSKYHSIKFLSALRSSRIIGSASHLSGGAATGHTSTHKPRVSSSKFVNSSSTNTSVGGRPSSAPNKRPPSPSTTHNSSSAAANSSTTASGHNRVKYTKSKSSGVTQPSSQTVLNARHGTSGTGVGNGLHKSGPSHQTSTHGGPN